MSGGAETEARPSAPRGRLRAFGADLWRVHRRIDPRTLGLFRIALGTLLSANLVRHWAHAERYYSNEGVLTNHFHLFRPSGPYNFSLFHAFSSPAEVHVAFAVALLVHLLYLVGYRTRLFAVLSFLVVTSLDNRLVLVENGGYVVVNLLVGWTMFMPTGSRFSVDALRGSFARVREAGEEDLRQPLPRPTEPFVSLFCLIAHANVAAIYFFNAVSKSGKLWKSGESVHYVLHLDRMVTGLAVFFREHLPALFYRPLTWSVLALEALLFAWIAWPRGQRVTRALAIAGMWALHATFGVMMRLGPFSWFMIGWSLLLIVPEHWNTLGVFFRRRVAPLEVVYDRASPLAFFLARLLRRLDPLERLRFEASREPGGEGGALLVAREPGEERGISGAAALRAVAGRLPLGGVFYPAAVFLSLGLLPLAYALAERRREAAARFFGLGAPESADPPVESPLKRRARAGFGQAREALAIYLGVCAVAQAIHENRAINRVFKLPMPAPLAATVGYPRMFQGWGMFAPNPIQEDGTVAVDAFTRGGRRLDPFTGESPDLDLTDARGLGLSQIEQDYFNRIRLDRNRAFRQPLRDYLLRFHERTGRPEDELVAFDVYWVKDKCPPFGESKPVEGELIPILTYRKPGWRPPPGQARPPPEPPVRSAGN